MSSKAPARLGLGLGALAVLAVPAAVVAAQLLTSLTLLRALYYSIPAALVLGLLAVLVVRRGRLAAGRSVFAERAGPLRPARFLAWLGVYAGVTAGIAVGVYWVLRARH